MFVLCTRVCLVVQTNALCCASAPFNIMLLKKGKVNKLELLWLHDPSA
jgi:hypothetical protein